jgi:hypothetical protein
VFNARSEPLQQLDLSYVGAKSRVLHTDDRSGRYRVRDAMGDYRVTDKVNIPELQRKLQPRIDMVAETAKRLAEVGGSSSKAHSDSRESTGASRPLSATTLAAGGRKRNPRASWSLEVWPMAELWEKRPQPRGGRPCTCVDLRAHGPRIGLVPDNVGVASAHLRTGTLWWYQMRGRQAEFFRKYIVFA